MTTRLRSFLAAAAIAAFVASAILAVAHAPGAPATVPPQRVGVVVTDGAPAPPSLDQGR